MALQSHSSLPSPDRSVASHSDSAQSDHLSNSGALTERKEKKVPAETHGSWDIVCIQEWQSAKEQILQENLPYFLRHRKATDPKDPIQKAH